MAIRKINKVDTKNRTIVSAPDNSGVLIDNIMFTTRSNNGSKCSLYITSGKTTYPNSIYYNSVDYAKYRMNIFDGKLYGGIGRDSAVTVYVTDLKTKVTTSYRAPDSFKSTDAYYGLNKGKAVSLSKSDGVIKIWDILSGDIIDIKESVPVPSTPEYYDDEVMFYEDSFLFIGTDKAVHIVDLDNGTLTKKLDNGNTKHLGMDVLDNQPVIIDHTAKKIYGIVGRAKRTVTGNINYEYKKIGSCFTNEKGDTEYLQSKPTSIDGVDIELPYSRNELACAVDATHFYYQSGHSEITAIKRDAGLQNIVYFQPDDTDKHVPYIYDVKIVVPAGKTLYYTTSTDNYAMHPIVPSILVGD